MHLDARLSSDIELGARRREAFDLEIIRSDSGFEDRNARHSMPLLEFDVSHPLADRDDSSYEEVLAAFRSTRGGLHSFDFEDFADHTATDASFGTGDGVEDTFQLVKISTFGGEAFERTIQRPAAADLVVKAAGVTVPGANYTLGDTGEIVFDTPPANGAALTWSGTFYIPVRFDRELALTGVTTEHDHIDTFVLVEVRLKAADFA